MEMHHNYLGEGIFEYKTFDGIINRLKVKYDVMTPFWTSGGMYLVFLEELNLKQRQFFGILYENHVEIGIGWGILDIDWTLYNKERKQILKNTGSYKRQEAKPKEIVLPIRPRRLPSLSEQPLQNKIIRISLPQKIKAKKVMLPKLKLHLPEKAEKILSRKPIKKRKVKPTVRERSRTLSD